MDILFGEFLSNAWRFHELQIESIGGAESESRSDRQVLYIWRNRFLVTNQVVSHLSSDVKKFMRKFLLLVLHHRQNPVPLDEDNTHQGQADQNDDNGEISFHVYYLPKI